MSPEFPPNPRSFTNGCNRRHPRMPFSIPITLQHLKAGVSWKSSGMSLDLSEGGFAALMNGNLREGETVEIDLPLSDHILKLIAIVRYSSNVRCGLEFLGLTPEERLQITDVTARRQLARSAHLAKVMG
jgi:c-di-GMP-binding flagellar brake protein YcgR